MKLGNLIFYTIDKANEKGITIGKTLIQKVLYFTLFQKEELNYKPYLYGPYSGVVQQTLNGLIEKKILTPRISFKNPENKPNSEPNEDTEKIDRVIDFLSQKNYISNKQVALLAKTFMFTLRNNNLPLPAADIREQAQYAGWRDFDKISEDNEIDTYSQNAKELLELLGYG